MAEEREMDYPTIEIVNGETLINGVPQRESLNGTFVREDGEGLRTIMHFQNDQLHNETGPALEVLGNNGKTMEAHYYRNGLLHAREYFYGSNDGKPTGAEYWKNGELHREDGPAIERSDGAKEWYRNGELHREDGPAVEAYGDKAWYKEGQLHRKDGPAIEMLDGTKEWYQEGKRHREDGPAVEYSDGRKEYYRDGKQVPPPETEKAHTIGKEQTGNRLEYKNGQYHINDRPVEDRNTINGRFVREGGDIERFKNGKLHSEGERPSVEKQDGTKMWHKEGELQKVERPNGEKLHFENGKMVAAPETEKANSIGKEQAGQSFSFGPQMKAGDLPVDSRNLLKDMVNAHEGKRSQEMQSKIDGAGMRQMQDTRKSIEHSQLMARAEETLKESGKTDGKVVHKDELTGKTVEYNLKNGELHSNGKDPSFVIRDKHGQIERAEYHQNGNITKSWDRETGQMFHHAPEKAQEKEMQKNQQEKDKSEKTQEKTNTENKSLSKNHSQENKGSQAQSKETKAKEETREEKLNRLKAARQEHQKQEKTHDRGERR